MSVTIKLRRGLASEWTSQNIILASGEPGFETDTGRLKIGDGITVWNSLFYSSIIPTGFVAGSGINFSLGNNGSTGTISVSGLNSSYISDFNEAVDDRIGTGLLVAGTGIILNYNDPGNSLTIDVQSSPRLVTNVLNTGLTTIPKLRAVYINGGQGDQATITFASNSIEATSSKTYGITTSDIGHGENGDIIVYGSLSGVNTSQFGVGVGSTLYLGSVSGLLTATKPSAPDHLVSVGTILRSHANAGVIEVRIQNGFELEELHNVAISGVSNGQFLQYNSSSGLWVASSSGNFTSLQLNGTTVSITGHTHSSSDITNFNTSVSGLLPSVTGGNYISSSFSNNTYTISATGLQPSGNYSTIGHTHTSSDITDFNEAVDDRIGSGLFVAGTGINLNYNDSGNSFTVSVTGLVANPTNNRILTSRDSTTTGIDAESNLTFDGANLIINSGLTASTGNFTVSVSGSLLNIDNIRIDSNTISSTNNNGNININPNGSGNIILGSSTNTSSSNYTSIIGGINANVTHIAELAHSGPITDPNGYFTTSGGSQHSVFIVKGYTDSSNYSTILTLDGAPPSTNNRLVLPNDTVWTFSIKLSAYMTFTDYGDSDCGGWIIRGCIRRNDTFDYYGIIGSPIYESFTRGILGNYAVTVSADTTNKALQILVADTNYYGYSTVWSAVVDISQVGGPFGYYEPI